MSLEGYAAMDVTPRENASGGKGVECRQGFGLHRVIPIRPPRRIV